MALTDLLGAAVREPRPFTSREARELASDTALEAAVTRGKLVRVLPGLYAAREHSASWQVRSLAACGWMPRGGAITGRGALFAWGVAADHGDDTSVVVPRNYYRNGPPWMNVVSQTHPVGPVVLPTGLVVTSPELALIHAYRWEPASAKNSLVYEACARGIDAGAVRELIDVLPRVPRRRALQVALERAGDGVESFLEERADVTVLTGAAFQRLVRQHRVTVHRERFRIDAFDPVTRTALEFDGARWHASPEQQERDKRRDAMLASIGILTVRFSFADVMARPQWCRAVALEVLRSRQS